METARPNPSQTDDSRAALVVAHPGHELLVHHWMETVRPLYYCLTDGSGKEGVGRLESTRRLLKSTGATQGPIYGRLTDNQVYQALLEGQSEIFTDLAKELTRSLLTHEVEVLSGDAPEGINPTHDLCRFLIDEAVKVVEQISGRQVRNYEFALESPPTDCHKELISEALWLHLDEEALDRKLQAAMNYTELRGETEEGLRLFGKQAFALECLRPSTTRMVMENFEREPPTYERIGQEGIERFGKKFGQYEQVITFQGHVKPVMQAIKLACQSLVSEYESSESATP